MNIYQSHLKGLTQAPTREYTDQVCELLAVLHEGSDFYTYAYMGLISELGELADLVAKSMRAGAKPISIETWDDELGDCYFYLTALFLKGYLLPDLCKRMINEIDDALSQMDAPSGDCCHIINLGEINLAKLERRRMNTGTHLK